MTTNRLYIIGGENFKSTNKLDKNSKVIFLEKVQHGFNNEFMLLDSLLENQNFLRKKWIKFQEEVFKKIRNKIDYDEDFQYVLSNIFFEASPNKTDTIYLFFKLYLIIDYIKKENIKNLFLINVTKEIKTFFELNLSSNRLIIKTINLQKNNLFNKKIFNQIERKNLFFSIFFTLINEFKKKKQHIAPKKSQHNKVVLSYFYPGGYSFNDRFKSRFFEDVSFLLNDNYHWLFQYVGKVSKINKENKLLSNNLKTFSFLDAYFNTKDFLNVISKYFKIRKKLQSIKVDKLFIFEEINYSCLFKNDWFISITILLLKLLIFEKKIENFFLKNDHVKEILYVMEYQPWEQMLNKIAKKHKILTKGVTHSIIRPNVMNYYHSNLIHRYFHTPSFVGANSDFSKSLLLKNGFNKDQVLEIEAHRFNYLADDKSKIILNNSQIKKTILIITSNIQKETIELLENFVLSNVKFEKVYIKEHHLLPVSSIIKNFIKNFPKYEIFQGTVLEAFKCSNIIYVANGSSVLLESVIKKKQTVSLVSLATLPIPAIEKANNLFFVSNVRDLSDILNTLISNANSETSLSEVENYLYLDNRLKLWNNFLKK